eukprot:m.366152 g.366152  ORF g.366152 m.366152 type:complete len:60 (-) comp34813_c0_seq1:36-215(-)
MVDIMFAVVKRITTALCVTTSHRNRTVTITSTLYISSTCMLLHLLLQSLPPHHPLLYVL